VHALLDLQINGLNKVDLLAKLISVENPCLYQKAIEVFFFLHFYYFILTFDKLNGMTVADLANKHMWTSAARQMIAVYLRSLRLALSFSLLFHFTNFIIKGGGTNYFWHGNGGRMYFYFYYITRTYHLYDIDFSTLLLILCECGRRSR
jgi:hypothetical protein